MNKTDHISNAHHSNQPVKGADVQVDLGPVGDLLHLVIANWFAIAIAIFAVLAIAYLFSWVAASGVKAVRPAAKKPWSDGSSGLGLGVIVSGGIIGCLFIAGIMFGADTVFSPIVNGLSNSVSQISG